MTFYSTILVAQKNVASSRRLLSGRRLLLGEERRGAFLVIHGGHEDDVGGVDTGERLPKHRDVETGGPNSFLVGACGKP